MNEGRTNHQYIVMPATACYGIPNDDGATLEAAVITAAGCWSSIDNAGKYSAIKHASLT